MVGTLYPVCHDGFVIHMDKVDLLSYSYYFSALIRRLQQDVENED